MLDNAHTDACRNCDTVLAGDYCHVCGQQAEEPRRAAIGLVQDVFVDTLAIDGKLFRTLWLLLTRPGRLARRYLDGRRVRYSPPFRLYLFASVFFFFTAFWIYSPDVRPDSGPDDGGAEKVESATTDADRSDADEAEDMVERVAEATIEAAVEDALEGAVSDGAGPEEPKAEAEEDDGDLQDMTWDDFDYDGPDWLEPVGRELVEAAKRATDDPRLFIAQLQETLPRTMLLAPVIYSVILILLYFYRRKLLVYDHLVVSLYMHAALYAHLLLAMLINQLPYLRWMAILTLGWALLQPYVVFRQAYQSNWVSVFLKGVISTSIYSLAFALLITLGLTYSLYNA